MHHNILLAASCLHLLHLLQQPLVTLQQGTAVLEVLACLPMYQAAASAMPGLLVAAPGGGHASCLGLLSQLARNAAGRVVRSTVLLWSCMMRGW